MSSDILRDVTATPLRAGVPILIAAVGMAALTILLSGLAGLREKADCLIRDFGANVFELRGTDSEPDETTRSLSVADFRLVAANLEHCSVSPVIYFRSELMGVGQVEVVGTDENYPRLRREMLRCGRLFDREDLLAYRRCAVVAASDGTALFTEPGRVISLAGLPFVVAGVLAAQPHEEGRASGCRIWIPWTTAGYWLIGQDAWRDKIHGIVVGVEEPREMERMLSLAKRVLKDAGRGASDVIVLTPVSLIGGLNAVRRSLILLAGSVTILGMGLGAVVLALIMTANVRERVVEIGLRRAMGATRSDISVLFLSEGCFSGAVAGLLGAIIGAGLISLWQNMNTLRLPLHPHVTIVPVAAGVIMGGIASWLPARLAARISPAEALRWE